MAEESEYGALFSLRAVQPAGLNLVQIFEEIVGHEYKGRVEHRDNTGTGTSIVSLVFTVPKGSPLLRHREVEGSVEMYMKDYLMKYGGFDEGTASAIQPVIDRFSERDHVVILQLIRSVEHLETQNEKLEASVRRLQEENVRLRCESEETASETAAWKAASETVAKKAEEKVDGLTKITDELKSRMDNEKARNVVLRRELEQTRLDTERELRSAQEMHKEVVDQLTVRMDARMDEMQQQLQQLQDRTVVRETN